MNISQTNSSFRFRLPRHKRVRVELVDEFGRYTTEDVPRALTWEEGDSPERLMWDRIINLNGTDIQIMNDIWNWLGLKETIRVIEWDIVMR